jgi:molecular chaperone HtpG
MLANIGNSHKDRLKHKGFRGIGRLGGLGYCRIVRFETSVKGETEKSVLEWDADALHAILIDQKEQIDAGELIRRITTIHTEKTEVDEHFFRVSLIDVLDTSDDLLDVEDVRKYLSMVAPVPFDYERFRFVEEIETFIEENKLPKLHEYHVYLNDDEIRKGYTTPLVIDNGMKTVEVLGVECNLLKHNDKTVGWYWYCVSHFDGVLPKACWQRCIRLRKSNIQIGEADCLSNHPKRGQALWKEDRGNNYFMGEIHALDERLIPNSRRDYFNQDIACREFEAALAGHFLQLHRLYHNASIIRASAQAVQRANDGIKAFKEKDRSNEFFDHKEREAERRRVNEQEEKARKASATLNRMRQSLKESDEVASAVVLEAYSRETPKLNSSIAMKVASSESGFVKDTLPSSTQSVLEKVFAVVDAVLPPEDAKLLRAAIMKRFGRK